MQPLNLGLLLALALAIGPGAFAQDSAPSTPRRIGGQVVDAQDGLPLRRARIAVSSGTIRLDPIFTDDQGRFAIEIPSATLWTVRITKGGYALLVTGLPEGTDADIEVALAKSAAVTGRVLDSFGAPVAAYVTGRLMLPDTGFPPPSSTQFYTRTDRLGQYRLGGLPPGRYEIVSAREPERRDAGTSLEDQLFGPRSSLDVADGGLTVDLGPGDELHNVGFALTTLSDTCPDRPNAPPAEAATGGISGRVTAATGEPLACAIVRVIAPGSPVPQAYTDQEGRYAVDGLPEGSFILEALRRDYITLQYGQRHPSDVASPVAVRAGERRERADIVLPRGSIISGTVVDERGEPMQGIGIEAVLPLPTDGGPVRVVALPAVTDDRGQYRLIGIDPGTYLVAAAASGMVSAATADGRRGYTPVYYPGTADAATAHRLALDVGVDATGIDLVVTPALMVTITGSVFDAAGRPFAGHVGLRGRSGAPSRVSRAAPSANGEFVIQDVPQGEYVLHASSGHSTGSPEWFGMRYVTAVDTDPPPVTVVVGAGAAAEGRVLLEGTPNAGVSGVSVSAFPVDFDYSPSAAATARTRADGSFRLDRLRGPRRFQITAIPACDGCYLKSVSINGIDAGDRPVDFGLEGGISHNLELVVSGAGGTIAGRAVDDRGTGMANFPVIVFSTDRAQWYSRSPRVKVPHSVHDGSFQATGLPPGDYYVVAMSRYRAAQFPNLLDPDVLEQLSAVAQRITIAERERRTLNLRVIRR